MSHYRPPISFDAFEPLSDVADIALSQIYIAASCAAEGQDELSEAAVSRLVDIALGREDSPAAQRHSSRSAAIDALGRCCDRSNVALEVLVRLARDAAQPALRSQAETALTDWACAGGLDRSERLSVVLSDLQADAACS
jgi:hypothetical protein